jgi:hypothetical protein
MVALLQLAAAVPHHNSFTGTGFAGTRRGVAGRSILALDSTITRMPLRLFMPVGVVHAIRCFVEERLRPLDRAAMRHCGDGILVRHRSASSRCAPSAIAPSELIVRCASADLDRSFRHAEREREIPAAVL